MKGTLRLAVLTATALLLLAVAARAEEGPTRTEYVEQVEPICQANTEASKRILKNAQQRAKSRNRAKMKQAGGQFVHASNVFGATITKLSAVPRPAADDARLRRWFDQLDIVRTNLRNLGKALKAGEEIKASHEGVRVERSSNAANNVSFIFEFHNCRLKSSSFF